MFLNCANAIRKEEEECKPIICLLTGKKCVCCSCLKPTEGFKMNSWAKDCPCFKQKNQAE